MSASVSKTCLVRFDNNRYSVSTHAVARPVEIRACAERIELAVAGPGARPVGRPRLLSIFQDRLAGRLSAHQRVRSRAAGLSGSGRAAAFVGTGVAGPPSANSPRRVEPFCWRGARFPSDLSVRYWGDDRSTRARLTLAGVTTASEVLLAIRECLMNLQSCKRPARSLTITQPMGHARLAWTGRKSGPGPQCPSDCRA